MWFAYLTVTTENTEGHFANVFVFVLTIENFPPLTRNTFCGIMTLIHDCGKNELDIYHNIFE